MHVMYCIHVLSFVKCDYRYREMLFPRAFLLVHNTVSQMSVVPTQFHEREDLLELTKTLVQISHPFTYTHTHTRVYISFEVRNLNKKVH